VNWSTRNLESKHWYESGDVLFALGAAAWLAALLLKWPTGLSFSDEIGYLGQARLFLEGRIHSTPSSPGIWNPTPHGNVAQYPLLVPLLLTPLFALSPRAIFLMGALPAIGLAWLAGRVLKAWGHSPCWGLLVLAHPTVVILARTAMSDVLLTALALSAWWALRNDRARLAIPLLAATMASRPTGVPIAAAIIAGEAIEARRHSPSPFALTLTPQEKTGVFGFALGLVLVLTSNTLATGTIWFGYNYRPGIPSFRPQYIFRTAPAYLRALVLNPPLLILGLIPLWRRKLIAPLLVLASFGVLMLFYVWVDWAPTWIESIVMSERLILPIVAFLLIGYAAGLSRLVARLRLTAVANVILVVAPAVVAFKIGARHRLWQEPMQQARDAATSLARQLGSDELGLTYSSSKAGLLFPGKTSWIVKDGPRPPVFLCATHGNSYRTFAAGIMDNDPCDSATYDGYHRVAVMDGFVLLQRDGVVAPPHSQ
jgi:hypothetical protein